MDRAAAGHVVPVHRVQDQDLEQHWSARPQALAAVLRAAPGRAPLQTAVAAAATERRVAGHRVGNPAEEDSRPEDNWQAAGGSRAAADRAAAAAAAGHPVRSME